MKAMDNFTWAVAFKDLVTCRKGLSQPPHIPILAPLDDDSFERSPTWRHLLNLMAQPTAALNFVLERFNGELNRLC